MSKISAKIVCDSLSPQGERLTTYILTYPRFIHAEVMTHRVFSRNTASSRAIPFEKMVKMVEEDPFIPIAWQKDHKGMQGTEYFLQNDVIDWANMSGNITASKGLTELWLEASMFAIDCARGMNRAGLTKQLCNRLLEPFVWHTALVTASQWNNFFELRCPKYGLFSENLPLEFRSKKDLLAYVKQVEADEFKNQYDNLTYLDWIKMSKSGAEIHIQALAEAMWDAYNESKPQQLQAGEYHIPFGDKIDKANLINYIESNYTNLPEDSMIFRDLKLKIAVARCARLSYMTFDNEINYQKDIELHDMLLKSKHNSPFEHIACAMSNEEYDTFYKGQLSHGLDYYWPNDENKGWCNNIRGFIQYRYLIEDEG